MGTIQTRLTLTALSTAVAGAIAWAWIASRPGNEPIRLVDKEPEAMQLLLSRRGEPLPDASPARLVREPIDAEAAAKLWPIDPALHVYDPRVYYRYKGGLDFEEGGIEGSTGHHRVHTSSEGYREDFDVLPEHRDLFVVVTGDSHTDGVCENRQSFANRLEARLAARDPGRSVEVLNTGVSGYSFYHYLGSLERHLDLRPDAFVVAFYGGNDFLDLIRPWHFFHHTVPPPRSHEYWKKLSGAQGISGALVGNAFNQLLYFQYNPDQMDVALEAAREVCSEIVRECREHRIAPLFVYIPPEIRAPGPGGSGGGARKPVFAELMTALELSDADLAQFDRLADGLIQGLKGLGADVLDLREHFTGDVSRYYASDMHINVKAHELVAELLEPRIESACLAQR